MILLKKKKLFFLKKKVFFLFFFAKWCNPCFKFKKTIIILKKYINIIIINVNIDFFEKILFKLKIFKIPKIILKNYFLKIKNNFKYLINLFKIILRDNGI